MPTNTRHAFALVALLILLAAPRVARIIYPQVWIEDESYLNAAFLLSRGLLPYRDFPLPHLPALEALLALMFRVAPVSIRTAELVTQMAAFAGSVLVFALGRRLAGGLAGGLAALLFATSALLFRYHVFEREVFLVIPVLSAVLIMSPQSRGGPETGAAVAAGVLMCGALSIKLTAVASFAALAIYVLLDGRGRSAAIMAFTTVTLLAAIVIALAVRFGTPFVVQVFVFRMVHAVFPSIAVKLDEMRYTLDVSLAAGIAGTLLILWTRQHRHWLGPLMQLVCGFIFLVLLNPTYWAHTGIELLPWLSLPGGYLLASVIRPVSVGSIETGTRRGERARAAGRAPVPQRLTGRASRMQSFVCLAAGILLLVDVAPIRNLNWEAGDGSTYGFGYRDRAELDTIGQFVRTHAAADDLVATPPIIAFIANRREIVPYGEIAGEIEELTRIVRGSGYRAALTDNSRRSGSFWETLETSRDRERPMLEAALDGHRIAVLINDSPDDLMPVRLIDVPRETLEAYGYRLESATAHYDAWVPH